MVIMKRDRYTIERFVENNNAGTTTKAIQACKEERPRKDKIPE